MFTSDTKKKFSDGQAYQNHSFADSVSLRNQSATLNTFRTMQKSSANIVTAYCAQVQSDVLLTGASECATRSLTYAYRSEHNAKAVIIHERASFHQRNTHFAKTLHPAPQLQKPTCTRVYHSKQRTRQKPPHDMLTSVL